MAEPPQGGAASPLESTPGEVGVYANLCNIQVTPEECILHFGQRKMEDPMQGVSVVRVFLSLPHAKRLVAALAQTLQRHEGRHGEIPDDLLEHVPPEVLSQLEAKIKELKERALE